MFRYSIFLNTIQSLFAALIGYIYLFLTTFHTGLPSILPDPNALPPLLLVSITSSLASPFGYASLKHIDYITFILAKSCKLLPVMALHLTVFRKRYPLYKYAVVALVTTGVAIFTLHHPSSRSKKSSSQTDLHKRNNLLGLTLLSINLLFDGLTNSTQDYIFSTFRTFTGPQMMCVQNLLNTLLTAGYMFLQPYFARKGYTSILGITLATNEYHDAMSFISRHPSVRRDILTFAACGAVGQIFICKNFFFHISFRGWLCKLISKSPQKSLHPLPFLLPPPRHGHRNEKNAHHDPERHLVRPSAHQVSMVGCGIGLWWCWCGGVHTEEGETSKGKREG